jgi:hypothetical protein
MTNKYIMNKYVLIRLLIVTVICTIFSSCAAPKYNYYYSTLGTDNPDIQVEKKSKSDYSVYTLGTSIHDKDSIFWVVRFSEEYIWINCRNNIPVYLDFQNSTVTFNDTSYQIISWYKEKTVPESGPFRRPMGYRTLGTVEFPSQMVHHLYEKYGDNHYSNELYLFGNSGVKKIKQEYSRIYHFNGSYSSFDYEYKTFQINVPTIPFTRESTPLKINVRLVYYTDSAYSDRKDINMDFYQTRLMKLPNIRYNKKRGYYNENTDYYRGELVGLEMEDISFYTKESSGTIWGWPEFRLGLGWTTTIICSPIIYPTNAITKFMTYGEKRHVFPTPLFE